MKDNGALQLYFDKDIFFKAIKTEGRKDILMKLFEERYMVKNGKK